MSAQAAFAADPRRRAMIGKVKIAQKELGLDDGTYRAVLQRVTGRASAADCTEAQLGKVLDDFKAKGWTPKPATTPQSGRRSRSPAGKPESRKARSADHPSAKKARALWISLNQLGEVRNASEQALEAFAKRQLGCERLQWADQGLTHRLIEALKAMAERAGWSQDLVGFKGDTTIVLKRRLLAAIHVKLGTPPPPCSGTALDAAIGLSARDLRERLELQP